MNFTKINKPNNTKDLKNKFILKNLNIIPNNKIISFSNMHKELSSINAFNNDKNSLNTNKLFSQLDKKNKKNQINLENNKSLFKLENNAYPPPKILVKKVTKKILNFDMDNNNNNFNTNTNKFEDNFNYNFSSNIVEYTK